MRAALQSIAPCAAIDIDKRVTEGSRNRGIPNFVVLYCKNDFVTDVVFSIQTPQGSFPPTDGYHCALNQLPK